MVSFESLTLQGGEEVSLANIFGIPVSSGQAIVGAISGVSAYKGEPVNKKALRGILRGWVTAPTWGRSSGVCTGTALFMPLNLFK